MKGMSHYGSKGGNWGKSKTGPGTHKTKGYGMTREMGGQTMGSSKRKGGDKVVGPKY